MKKTILYLSFFALVGLFTNCNSEKKSYQTNTETGVTNVDRNNKEMNDAISKAQSTFDKFEKAFIDNKKTNKYDDFIVKIGFPTKDGSVEHMWVSDITYDGKRFSGILVNEPVGKMTIKYGDSVNIDQKKLSDWMYTDTNSGDIYGGYTMQVIRKHMSAEEGAAFDEQMGGKFVDQ